MVARAVRPASLAVALVVSALVLPAAPVLAQDGPVPFTYVAEWTIPRDQWAGYAEWTARHHRPILERLASEGKLLDWGHYETYIHADDGPTHGTWWSAATFADIEGARLALLKAPFHPAATAGAHHDFLFRPIDGGRRSATLGEGFLHVSFQEIRPGEEAAWKALWDRTTRPVFEALVASGDLASYSVLREDVHTATSARRAVVTISTSAAAEDRIEAAFAAARAGRTPAEREELSNAARATVVQENHRDYLARLASAWLQ